MDPPHTSKKPRLDRSADLLNIPNKVNKATPGVLIVNKKSPSIFRVGESKFVAGVKKFLDSAAIQQDQSTDDLNIEVVSEGEAYIDMTLGLIPLEEEDTDELSDRSDSESSETSCEDLKLPDGRYVQKQNTENINEKLLIEEIENK